MRLVLFPNQLFAPKELKKLTDSTIHVHLVEHTLFYGNRKYQYITSGKSPKATPMRFNRRKLVFHRATMLRFIDECKAENLNITFHENINSLKEIKKELISNASKSLSLASLEVVYFDPVDRELLYELNQSFPNGVQLDTPYFLFSHHNLYEYLELGDKTNLKNRLTHSSFYKFALEKLDIPFIKKSYDTENRGTFDEKDVPLFDYATYENKYIDKAIEWLNDSKYKDNPGSIDNWWLPIMREGAERQLKEFLKNDLKHFGKYQDAMVIQRPFLYHSRLSSLLNIGLLTPRQVVDETIRYYKKNRTKIPIASFEGFIRQIIGWREYERMIYHIYYVELVTSNEFNHKHKLNEKWYTKQSQSGCLLPLDDAISQAWQYGYLHHIYRLMVVSNAMNLMGIMPYEAYRWFMEFATDSYDWVMIGNVYSMGMWADGGKTMRKPYISSNSYIEKMSLGYKEGDWGEKWRGLYYHFLGKHSNILKKTIYARNLGALKKMKNTERISLNKLAQQTIRYYTKN